MRSSRPIRRADSSRPGIPVGRDIAAETTRVTYDIDEDDNGVTRLTVTHEVEGAPITAAQIGLSDARLHEGGGGWPMILSDLKTLLETGESL